MGRFITPDPLGFIDGPNPYLYCLNDPVNFVDLWGLYPEKAEPWWRQIKDWWLYESVIPGPYGSPVSERGISANPYTLGDPLKYTEAAGVGVMWTERIAYGTSVVTASLALGGGILEMAGIINTAPQANNIIRIISKVFKWGYRIDKSEPGKGIHQHFWRW